MSGAAGERANRLGGPHQSRSQSGQLGTGVDHRKRIVRRTYDRVADSWGQARRSTTAPGRERTWMERFLASVPHQATLLDLGCGSGAPILADLLRRGHRVVGVDFSREQLREARVRCPEAFLVLADIGDVDFAEGSFAGIIAYDSLWHLPRHEHRRVFEGMRKWLVRGVAALLTVAAADGELFTELMGAPVFYDAWPEATSLTLLRTAGFSIVGRDFQPVGNGRSDGHLIVLAMAA
jgi:SAM-dependent methyltransferase